MDSDYHFEVMAIQKEEQNISSNTAMLYLLAANSYICSGIKNIDIESHLITLEHNTKIQVQSIPNTSSPLNDQYYGVFQINLKGNYDNIEPLRIPFIKYLIQNRFTIFIVNDEISQQMTKNLYPLINKVETYLRTYLIKFFIKTYGTEFFDKIADKDMNTKLSQTEKNLCTLKEQLGIQNGEKLSASKLKINMYGIEFSQLGKIIYSDKLGSASSLDDAIKLIKNSNNFSELKNKIFCFGDKYFKKSFIDKDFQHKWEELTRIRHVVAHNNICLDEDYKKGTEIAEDVINIINDAIADLDQRPEQIYKQGASSARFMDEDYKIISPEILLDFLKRSENFEIEHDGYVGLRWFVATVLYEKQGYAIGPSYAVVNNLAAEKKIEIYDYMVSEKDYSIKAIRTIA